MTFGRLGWAAIVVAAIGAFAAAVGVTATIKTDLSFFFPRSSSAVIQLVVDRFRDGPASRTMLISISGGPASTLARASDSFSHAIAESDRFLFTANGRPPAPKEVEELFAYRYLLNPPIQSEDFSAESLRRKLKAALQMLGTTLGAQIKQVLPADPTLRVLDILRYWRGQTSPHRVDGVWFTPDGNTALIVAQTRAPPFDYTAQSADIDWLHETFGRLPGAQGLRLDLTGPSVFAVEAQRIIKSEVQWLNICAFLAVALLILLTFRSLYILLPLMAPLAAGILVGAAATQAIFGYIHGASLAFGSTLIGVAIDYPLHVAVHERRLLNASQAVRRIWPTLRLSALTTMVAFGSLVFSTFPGLSQLGVVAVTGILTAALMTRWLLPRLLSDRAARPMTMLRLPSGGPRARLAAGIGATIAAIAALAILASREDSLWQQDLTALSPLPRSEQERDRDYRAAVGAADVRRLLVVAGASAEEVLARSETLADTLDRLVREGRLAGFDMAAKYLPSVQAQKSRQEILPSSSILAASLDEALHDLPYRSGQFDAFLRDVETARTAPPLTREGLNPGLLDARVGTLLFESGRSWVGLVALIGIEDDNAVRAVADSASAPWLHYVDLKAATDEIATGYRWEALTWLAGGVVVALGVLLYGLGRIRSVLEVVLPVLGAIVLTAGILAFPGMPLSIFHLIGLLLVGGLGMDYGLFFNRREDDAGARDATFTAIALCCATTVTVFGILAASALPVLNSIGQTVAIGTFVAFVLCFLFRRQPAGG